MLTSTRHLTVTSWVDYIIVGSDSGRIVILEYIVSPPSFKKLHQETYGKSGSRRIVPGQYLATDPKGRAVMIGAVEKAKLVYILNRDAAANLTISSPLEAHKQQAIILSMVGVDVGFDNPLFAALEVDYSDSDNDPTGEAFNNAEKVRVFLSLYTRVRHFACRAAPPIWSVADGMGDDCADPTDAYLLRAGSWSQPRREEMVGTNRPAGQYAYSG